MEDWHGGLAWRIGMEDLTEPSPKCGQVSKVALAFRAIYGLQEIGRQHGIEKHRVSAEGL